MTAAILTAMFALNVALYAWMFIRARRQNRQKAALRRLREANREVRQ